MKFYTTKQQNNKKLLLLGGGELGKEIVIEASRLGFETVVADSYANPPASFVANSSVVVDMKDRQKLVDVVKKLKPDFVIPEIEALSLEALEQLQNDGYNIVPNARAIKLTMNRKNIRQFACEELGLKASAYKFVESLQELKTACSDIGYPCVIKPVMSSSGHGQTIAKSFDDIENSWNIAKEARGDSSLLIVEEFIRFDYEITLLTVRSRHGTVFCEPIGHTQKDGDYIFSHQPAVMSDKAKKACKKIATDITDGLGGYGVFGVELFIKGDEVYFSEVSPRPHDTGMVTMITQSASQFALHVRAIVGLGVEFVTYGAGASGAIKADNSSQNPFIELGDEVFGKHSFARVFGKPYSKPGRRMGVVLCFDKDSSETALKQAQKLVENR